MFDPGDVPLLYFTNVGPFQLGGNDHHATIMTEVVVEDIGGQELSKHTTPLDIVLAPGSPFMSFGVKVETHPHWVASDYTARVTIRDGLNGDEFTYEAPFFLR